MPRSEIRFRHGCRRLAGYLGVWILLATGTGCNGDALATDRRIGIDAGNLDGGVPDLDEDAQVQSEIDAGEADAGPAWDGIAPEGTMDGAEPLADGMSAVQLSADTERVFRIDTQPDEHVAFRLDFDSVSANVEMVVDRWTGSAIDALALTNEGLGIRTLAVFDSSGRRTFWVTLRTEEEELDATLTVARTPFADGARCESDCDRLLQLPLPNDPFADGYDHHSSTIFRYQFGRRDLLMFVRYAARRMAEAGYLPVLPHDFSQWDGETPGIDVGAKRHASHQRGKDVDISLYGDDGNAFWRSYCEVTYDSDPEGGSGRICVDGSMTDYDGYANALHFAALFENERVTYGFLDAELIPSTLAGANDAFADGLIDEAMLDMMSDTLSHWPNHDNHIHVRVSEQPYDDSGAGSSSSALIIVEGC